MSNPEKDQIVYIREADADKLPDHLQGAGEKLFAVHDRDGKCLALAKNRTLAFALARQNDLTPVSVH